MMVGKAYCFERNLLALSVRNPALGLRLRAATQAAAARPPEPAHGYVLLEARTGDTVPALSDAGGVPRPLHSLMDPRKEGARMMGILKNEGFIVFLGLGGGFSLGAALERKETVQVLIIDYDVAAIAELLSLRDYAPLLSDTRCSLLVDADPAAIEQHILDWYQPVLAGGLGVIPLRARIERDRDRFAQAERAVNQAVTAVGDDYAVQAVFGLRWFSNIIHNLPRAEVQDSPIPLIKQAAVCAAGPSLEDQLPVIARTRCAGPRARDRVFLIATDTSLPCLLNAGIEPDAVVSIDCQHISYYHFMQGLPDHIPLYLDLTSPPAVAAQSRHPRFFAGGHPLARYVSTFWRPVPPVDTSGGNVTYAALSLAEGLGATHVDLYGADFAYPEGRCYARGTYLFSYFALQQDRFAPLEALFSGFLYRSPALTRVETAQGWYYETPALTRYRQRLEHKIAGGALPVTPAPGHGAAIAVPESRPTDWRTRRAASPARPSRRRHRFFDNEPIRLFAPGSPSMPAADFLQEYRRKLNNLPRFQSGDSVHAFVQRLTGEEGLVLSTILPGAAAMQRRHPELTGGDLFNATIDASFHRLGR